MLDRNQKSLCGLPRERPSAVIDYRTRDDHRNTSPQGLEGSLDCKERRLTIECVENGLHREQIDAAVQRQRNPSFVDDSLSTSKVDRILDDVELGIDEPATPVAKTAAPAETLLGPGLAKYYYNPVLGQRRSVLMCLSAAAVFSSKSQFHRFWPQLSPGEL